MMAKTSPEAMAVAKSAATDTASLIALMQLARSPTFSLAGVNSAGLLGV